MSFPDVRRLLLVTVALTLVVSACGSDGAAEQSDTTAPPAAAATTTSATTTTNPTTTTTTTSPTPTTSTTGPTVTTTTTEPMPADEMLAAFLEATAGGDVESSIAMARVVPGEVEFWNEDRLTNLVEFFGAIGDRPVFTVGNCSIVGTVGLADGVGEKASCDVTLAIISDGASAVVGLALTGQAEGVAFDGFLSRLKLPTFEFIMDAVTFQGLTADVDGHEAACAFRSSMQRHHDVTFSGACGTWLAAYFDDFEAFVLAEEIVQASAQFALSCARCHGTDLDGGRGGPTLLDAIAVGFSDEFKHGFISRGGTRGMPAFTRLSDDQIDDLIAYIREVQAG